MTQQPNTGNTSVLDSLIGDIMTQVQQERAEEERQAEETKQEKHRNAEQALQELLKEYLSSEFLASIHFEIRHHYYNGNYSISAYFPYADVYWHIQPRINRHDVLEHFDILTSGTPNQYTSSKRDYINPKSLQVVLLFEMGKYAEQARVRKIADEENRVRQEAYEARMEQQRQEAEQARLERIAEADAEHQRLMALLEAKQVQAKKDLWRWFPSTTIELYRLQYCNGSAYNPDNEAYEFEYERGWTATSSFDEQGRIRFEPTAKYYSTDTHPARIIQLLQPLDRYYPSWEVHTYSSVEELPDVLQQEVTVSLPSVVWERDYDCRLDGESRLVQVDRLQCEQEEASLTVGQEPLPWIRALVDQVANGE